MTCPIPAPTPTPPNCSDNLTKCDGSGKIKHHHFSTKTGSKVGGLIQIPSNKTDYPDNDLSVIQVHVISAKKDIIGDYELKGEVTNVGNDSLRFVHITAHLYDAAVN